MTVLILSGKIVVIMVTGSIDPMSQTQQNNDRTPVVQFEYPDSASGKMKTRYLRVVEADADYVKGYELDNAGSKKDGQFKTFSRNRLVTNGVSLVSF